MVLCVSFYTLTEMESVSTELEYSYCTIFGLSILWKTETVKKGGDFNYSSKNLFDKNINGTQQNPSND